MDPYEYYVKVVGVLDNDNIPMFINIKIIWEEHQEGQEERLSQEICINRVVAKVN